MLVFPCLFFFCFIYIYMNLFGFRRQENYKEAGWSAMSELEGGLQRLEADVAKQFGDHSDDSGAEGQMGSDTENGGECECESTRVCVCACE